MTLEASIPKEAQDQAALAEELFNKMYPPQDVVPDEETPPDTPPEPEPTPEPEPQPVVDTEEETYRQRYQTLQGKYNSEVPKLAQELRELKALLQNRQEQPVAPVQPEPEVLDPRIEKLRAEYGDELVEDWKALIRSQVESAIKPVIDQTKQVEQTVEQNVATQAQQTFVQKVAQASPDGWENLWDSFIQARTGEAPIDPLFVEFLDKKDPAGLYTYGDILVDANSKWDADKMARVFQLYTESKQQPTQPTPTAPAQPSQAEQDLVAPSRATTQPTPNSDSARIWTPADIQRFQNEDRRGVYDDATSQALWNDLLAASREGRIRG